MESKRSEFDDALEVRTGDPVEYMPLEDLLEEIAKRGHNFLLILADSTGENDPSNLLVDYVSDGAPVDPEDETSMTTNGLFLLWALGEAYMGLYDRLKISRACEDGAFTDRARVNMRLARIYNEFEGLSGSSPDPFEEQA